jgi:spore germination cell wall hydrolase CwlJ-like protein
MLDPLQVSTLPARRLPVGVLIAALLAVLLIVGSITLAVLSLRQRPNDDFASPATVRQIRQARIEAPFAPATLRPLSAEQAVAWNAATPAVASATEAASTFLLRTSKATDFQRSLQCLTMAIYYEAGSESDDGERAVAQVILNRVRHPAYPKTVCGVVRDGAHRGTGCQFTFVCDGSLARTPSARGWLRAGRIATAALGGAVFAPVGWATHYHANYVVPYWAASLDKVAAIGAHIFYRWNGLAGRANAFHGVYAGNEPVLTLPPVTDTTPAVTTAATAAGVSGVVPPTERPVLTGPRADAPGATVGLVERRVLSRAADIGEPPSPERRVLPAAPVSAN